MEHNSNRRPSLSGESTITLGLNAYSFNIPLRGGEMTLFDLIDFCSSVDLIGLDATGYYFPGYPEVPEDRFVYDLKRKAFLNGITITGTGVRNDFSVPDDSLRKRDVQMVKDWIKVAKKLGASVIRIFSGEKVPENYTFDQVLEWMIPDIEECVAFGREHGIIVGLQNHNDFLKTSSETIKIAEAVHSEWFGIILDVGSLRQSDPYEEIARLLPYAVSWQLKENVWYGDQQVRVDIKKIRALIDRDGYCGFMPLETLGSGDPKAKLKSLLSEVREHF